MMLAISTLTIDPFGAQLLDLPPGAANLGDTARRVSRVATLDGGASILDGGYTVADRTISVDLASQSREVIDALKYLFQQHTSLILCTEDGAFKASPERISISGNSARMSLLVVGVAEIKL
jgi:hypothetical protein